MKKIFVALGLILVVLIGVVVIGPGFIDANALKREVTAQVRSATGRDLTIDGNLQIRFLPAPTLTANAVRLSNAVGAQKADMVTLKAVEVRVALLPLLSGQVQVERIRLVNPVVNLEKLSDGRTNLDFSPAFSGASSGASSSTSGEPQTTVPGAVSKSAGDGLNIRLDNFELVGGRIVYLDATTGVVEQIENLEANLRAGSLNGPFEARGQARLRGVPLTFEVSVGQIIERRTVSLNAILNAPGGGRAQITGAGLGLGTDPYFKGKVNVNGTNLAQLIGSIAATALTPGGAGVLAQSFALDSAVSASATGVNLNELDVQLGKSRIAGDIKVNLRDGVEFDVNMKAGGIDVDALLAATALPLARAGQSQGEGAVASGPDTQIAPRPPQTRAEDPGAGRGFAFPKGVRGTVQVAIDAVTLKGKLVSDVRFAAELADGELAVSQLQAMAPGVTDVAMFGFVRPSNGVARFEGDVELISADPTTLADWLGVRLPVGVSGRVKRIVYKSKLSADARQVELKGLQIIADQSTLRGGVTLALRKRLSFGADLRLDTLNVDTYVSTKGAAQQPLAMVVNASVPNDMVAQQDQQSTTVKVGDVMKIWSTLSRLNDFDANLKVRVGSLTQGGKTFKDLQLDSTLYAGALTLRRLSLGDFQGARGSLSGTFNGFGGVPELSQVKVAARVKNARTLALKLGLEGLPKGLGEVAVQATADGSVLTPRLDVNVKAVQGELASRGRLSMLPLGFGYEGTVRARHGDVAALLRALGVAYRPAGPLGGVNVRAKVKTDGKTHTFTDVKSTLGETPIDGTVKVRTDGAKVQVVADLQSGDLILDRFMAKAQNKLARAAVGSKRRSRLGGAGPETVILAGYDTAEVAQKIPRNDARWSRDRIDLGVLEMLDGELTLRATAVQFGAYKLSDANIHATVQDGVMVADQVSGTMFGGPVVGSATVRSRGAPTIETELKLDTLQVADLARAVAGKKIASGQMSVNLGLKASGLSMAEWVRSLGGGGDLKLNDLDVQEGGKGSPLSGVIGLVAAMNELSLGSVKKGQGLADVSLAFNLQDGVATTENLTVASAVGTGTGAGTVDIAGWGIDFAGNMTVEPNLLTSLLSKGRIGRQVIPFSVRGALDNPGVNLGGGKGAGPAGLMGGTAGKKIDPFRSLIEKALPGLKVVPQAAPQTAPPAGGQNQPGTLAPPPPVQGSGQTTPPAKPQKPSAEDLIKQLLKGL